MRKFNDEDKLALVAIGIILFLGSCINCSFNSTIRLLKNLNIKDYVYNEKEQRGYVTH